MLRIVKKSKQKNQNQILELRALELLLYGVILNPQTLTDKVFEIIVGK